MCHHPGETRKKESFSYVGGKQQKLFHFPRERGARIDPERFDHKLTKHERKKKREEDAFAE